MIDEWAAHRWNELELQAINNGLYGGTAPTNDGYDKKIGNYKGLLSIRREFLRKAGWALPGNAEIDEYLAGYHRVLGTVGIEALQRTMKLPDQDGNIVEINIYHEWADELRVIVKEQFAELGIAERNRWLILARQIRELESSTE